MISLIPRSTLFLKMIKQSLNKFALSDFKRINISTHVDCKNVSKSKKKNTNTLHPIIYVIYLF